MANTFPSTLVSEIVHSTGLTSLGTVIGAVNSFAHDVAPDPVSPGSVIKVGITTGGSAAVENPTNYETGDSTKEQRNVTAIEINKSFHVSQAQLNKGHSLQSLIAKNMQIMANKCRDIVFAPITEANFGNAEDTLDKTAAAFVPADLQTIWAAGKNFPERHLLLDGAYYAKLLPTDANSFRPGMPGAYGFDSIGMNNRWDGAQSGTIGFLGGRDALLIGSGEPVMDSALENALDSYEEVPLDGGLAIYVASWASLATRHRWMSLGLMLGADAGDTTAGKIIGDGVTDPGSVGEP